MRQFILTCALSLSAGFVCAQANEKGASFNLTSRVPEKGERVVVTRFAPSQSASGVLKGSTASQASPATAAAPAPSMPAVPGSLPGAAPFTAAASAVSPASAQTRIATTNEVGAQGGPAKTYASMQEAAKDGIDPLKVGTFQRGLPTLEGPKESQAFNWGDPLSYVQWVQDHPKDAVKYGGTLLVALIAFSMIRRRAGVAS